MNRIKKSIRKKVKWVVILLNILTTSVGILIGSLPLLYVTSLLFWVYVLLDKFNPLTKNANVYEITKKSKKFKMNNYSENVDVNVKFYDNSQDNGY